MTPDAAKQARMIERVRALLAMTTKNGCTAGFQALALVSDQGSRPSGTFLQTLPEEKPIYHDSEETSATKKTQSQKMGPRQ